MLLGEHQVGLTLRMSKTSRYEAIEVAFRAVSHGAVIVSELRTHHAK